MPNMKSIITLIILVLVLGGFLWYQKYQKAPATTVPNENVVSGLENIQLIDADGRGFSGDANRSYNEGKTTLGIRAENLPTPKRGAYSGWLKDGDDLLYAGQFQKVTEGDYKDDYVLGFLAEEDLRHYKEVLITLEENTDDQKPEKIILQGYFQ